jgi:hypothetical protein
MSETKIHNLLPRSLWIVYFEEEVFAPANQKIETGLETLVMFPRG